MDKCPHCTEPFEFTRNISGNNDIPKVNDVIVCGACFGVLLVIPDEGVKTKLKLVSPEDVKNYPPLERKKLMEAHEAAAVHRTGGHYQRAKPMSASDVFGMFHTNNGLHAHHKK